MKALLDRTNILFSEHTQKNIVKNFEYIIFWKWNSTTYAPEDIMENYKIN